MRFEQAVLTQVTEARANAVSAGAGGPAQAAATVRDYDTAIASFPARLMAGSMGFTRREFFEADPEAREVPSVQLR